MNSKLVPYQLKLLRAIQMPQQQAFGALLAVYRQFIDELCEEERFELLQAFISLDLGRGPVGHSALVSFALFEPSLRIVATAVVEDVSQTGPPGTPGSLVDDYLQSIRLGAMVNRAAAFGALMHIGHRGICALLRPMCSLLRHDELPTAMKCSTGTIHAATVEFCLDWLESLPGDAEDGVYGLLAGGLILLAVGNRHSDVFTGDRPFPFPTSLPRDKAMAALKPVPLETYVKQIALRLYALHEAESPPRTMDKVLTAWKLPQPASRSSGHGR